MTINRQIEVFSELGKFLAQFSEKGIKQRNHSLNEKYYSNFSELIQSVKSYNAWFTEENVRNSIGEVALSLKKENLENWMSSYKKLALIQPKRVAVIMAGNVPLVGFHDMLCVLMSGNIFIGKLSSEDKLLLPLISKMLISIAPEFERLIKFTDGKLEGIESVIATGSNNTARYFDYYFGKYPNIIRKNRNSVAVISGEENTKELQDLGKDIFQYFGLGCRNVSKLYVPKGYKFDMFYESIYKYHDVIINNKYCNNYEYNRTVYLMGKNPSLLDNNFLLLKEDQGYSSPIGVLYFEYYDNIQTLTDRLLADKTKIQCVVAKPNLIENSVPFGQAQCPSLTDYADGIDTMKFLETL